VHPSTRCRCSRAVRLCHSRMLCVRYYRLRRTPDCAVRSDHSFTTAMDSDKGIFPSDLNAARNVNMSDALNQNSLRMSLNHRVPGSSHGAPTKVFKDIAGV
jgi:hypothetical protein